MFSVWPWCRYKGVVTNVEHPQHVTWCKIGYSGSSTEWVDKYSSRLKANPKQELHSKHATTTHGLDALRTDDNDSRDTSAAPPVTIIEKANKAAPLPQYLPYLLKQRGLRPMRVGPSGCRPAGPRGTKNRISWPLPYAYAYACAWNTLN